MFAAALEQIADSGALARVCAGRRPAQQALLGTVETARAEGTPGGTRIVQQSMRLLAVLLLLIATAACSQSGEIPPASVSAGDSVPTQATAVSPEAAVTSVDDGVVRLTVTVAEETVAGERLWAKLSVRHIGDRPVWWQAGGGLPPASAVLTSSDARKEVEAWSGAPGELAGALPQGPSEMPFREEEHVGLLTVGRNEPSVMTALHPGEEREIRVAADVRLRPGFAEELVARAVATFYDDLNHYGGEGSVGPRPPVVAEAPVRVVGRPIEDSDRAVEAFAADRRLQRFLGATRVDSVENRWHVELVWWSSAWELTVTPHYSDEPRGQSRYRLRYSSGEIVDARRIWWDQAPADDPGGTRFPAAPDDDVEK